MNTEKTLDEIIKDKRKILTPIFNGLAYLDVEITDNKFCLINLGDNYYVKTKIEKAKEISKRINLEKAKNENNVTKLDDNTFEIKENIALHEEEEEKKKNKKKQNISIDEKIKKENEMLLAKINDIKEKKQSKKTYIKRLKLRKKEDIIDTVLKKIN